MNRSDSQRSRRQLLMISILRGLFFYVLIPLIPLWLLASPISSAARLSGLSAFLILLAAAGVICLNWYVYSIIRHRRPTLLIYAHGLLCLLVIVFIEHDALLGYYAPEQEALRSTLAAIGVPLAIICLLLFSFWLASRKSRPAHAISVGIRVALGAVLFIIALQIVRDIECRRVTRDTWITIGALIVLLLAFCGQWLHSLIRRSLARRRKSCMTTGKIIQIVGETRLDLDGDPVTHDHARVRYTVDGVSYETRADIARITVRRYGKDAFVGREIPVFYHPENPGEACTNRIDRHIFDQSDDDSEEESDEAGNV